MTTTCGAPGGSPGTFLDDDPVREDGRSFTRYVHDPADSSSLSGNSVTALCETSQGDLWVGTWGGGLDRLNPSTHRFEHFRETPDPRAGIPNNFVRSLAEDRSGVLWIGTWGGRARRVRSEGKTVPSLPP
jgi:ligand-binding sensor domain-containing protein